MGCSHCLYSRCTAVFIWACSLYVYVCVAPSVHECDSLLDKSLVGQITSPALVIPKVTELQVLTVKADI